MPSAGEVEQFAYCAHNWLLARQGAGGEGEGSRRGIAQHGEMGRAQRRIEQGKADYRRALLLALLIVLVAASFLFLAVSLYAHAGDERRLRLVALALVLTSCSSTLLTFALVARQQYRRRQRESGVVPGRLLASDLAESAPLLVDARSGLQGRPDVLLATQAGPVPIEVKTGRTPQRPYRSHRLQLACYLHLLETDAARAHDPAARPPYGLLQYPDGIFRVAWDDGLRSDLAATLERLAQATATGVADRDHEEPGRCRGCSRRAQCGQRLA